jgi:hypothetical protein
MAEAPQVVRAVHRTATLLTVLQVEAPLEGFLYKKGEFSIIGSPGWRRRWFKQVTSSAALTAPDRPSGSQSAALL